MKTDVYVCLQSWAPVRASNSSASEMVTSLLFGETCICIDETDDWLQIKTTHDLYVGYISKNYVTPYTDYQSLNWKIVKEPYTYLKSKSSIIQLSPGSRIPDSEILIEGNLFQWVSGRDGQPFESIFDHAKWFLNTPYLWGGRSIFGIDCSGFIQVLGQMSGFQFPRDAYQQADLGQRKKWSDRKPGDLCYFENANGKITHVGMIWHENSIIHASGKVRIDSLTPQGIVHSFSNQITHKLADLRTWS